MTTDGAFTETYIVYDLPDPGTLGPPTMVGTCDVAPNQCVIGIFAASPQASDTFACPISSRLPSTSVGDGLVKGVNPGDGSAPPVTATSPTNSTVVAGYGHRDGRRGQHVEITVALKDTDSNLVTTENGDAVTGLWPLHYRGRRLRRADRDDQRRRTGGLHRQRHVRRDGDLHRNGHHRQRDGDPSGNSHLSTPAATPSDSSIDAASTLGVPEWQHDRSP